MTKEKPTQSVFRECDIRGIARTELTPSFVYDLGLAFGTLIRNKRKNKVLVGRDVRSSSKRISKRLIEGILASGCDCIDVGEVPTPVFYFSQNILDVDGGIMVTGSHNPSEYNGFKPVLKNRNLWGRKLLELEAIMQKKEFFQGAGTLVELCPMNHYRQYLGKLMGKVKGMKVVVDSMHGCGGFLAPDVFHDAGIEVVSLNGDKSGKFGSQQPDPSREESLKQLKAEVLKEKADLGIAFDGDADRLGVIDGRGQWVPGDELLAFFCQEFLAPGAGEAVVYDVKCSDLVREEIERLGGRAVISPTGHSLIKEHMKNEKAVLGGEFSGHFFFRKGHFGFDDPFYAALFLCRQLAERKISLQEFRSTLPKRFSTPDIRIPCPRKKGHQIVAALADHFRKDFPLTELDGTRIQFPNGWGLVRVSNTEPSLTLRFEAKSTASLASTKKQVMDIIDRHLK